MRPHVCLVMVIPEENQWQDIITKVLNRWNHWTGQVKMLKLIEEVNLPPG
jgi:hypothetical protein